MSKVRNETYSQTQKEQKEAGKGKRADILYNIGSVEHSVDVKITSSWTDKGGNAINRAWTSKQGQYGKEPRVHIVLFDTVGNVAKESLDFLREIGVDNGELREIQRIILEYTSGRVLTLAERGKQKDYKDARKKARNERRKSARMRKKALQDGSSQGGTGELSHK